MIVTINFGVILPVEDRFLVHYFRNNWYFAGLGSWPDPIQGNQ